MTSLPQNTVRFPGGKPTARVVCPWCRVLTGGPADLVHDRHQLGPSRFEFVVVYKCGDPGCQRASLLVLESEKRDLLANVDYSVTIIPPLRSTYAPEGVPDALAKDFREALDSRAAGYLYGAAVVGRRVLQAAVRSFVGEHRTLRDEIDALTADQVPGHLKRAAHQVRFVGNDAAHADEVTPAEADDLLSFTEQLLQQLFVLPAQVAAAEARRQQKP